MSIIDYPVAVGNFTSLSLNPYPVLPAFISASGNSVLYDCPWCGARHRHRVDRTKFINGRTNKQTHCAVWRRRFPRQARPGADFVRVFLAYDSRSQRAA